MDKLSSTQIGTIAENHVANMLMITTGGRLSAFRPVADDDGIDLLIYDKRTGRALPAQVKCRTVTINKSGTTERSDIVHFELRKATYRDRPACAIFVLLTADATAIEMAWVVPAVGHAEVREEGNRVGRREEVRCPMQSSDELERSAQWRPMRTFGAWHSRPWVDRGHRGDATTGARHSVKSKGTVPPETLELLGPDFVGDVGRFVYPIFTDRDGAPKSIGSGFLVRFDGFVCLITAAHVLDHIRRNEDLYWYAGTAIKRHVDGQGLLSPMPPSGNRDDDRIDVGVVILSDEGLPPYADIGMDALPADRLHMGATPRTDKKFAVLGFPASKASVHRPDKYVRSASYSYLASSIPPNEYAPLGIAEQSHIAIHFDKKRVNHPDGRKMNFPKPAGISGSPLWELRRQDEGRPRIVGVMIENKQSGRAMVATDIGYALMMLADHFVKLDKARTEGSHERQANQASSG